MGDPEAEALHENLCLLCNNSVAGISRSVQDSLSLDIADSKACHHSSALLVCLKFDPWIWIW